jgi:diadenosine tetraphosphate (Ap4A) HIT family hydrolase
LIIWRGLRSARRASIERFDADAMLTSPASPGWELHPQLANDTFVIGDLRLCRVLLMNDANYPWLVLVPRRLGVVEIIDLDEPSRAQLMEEVASAGEVLKAVTRCEKLNVAAIGNVVAQLHVHIVGRFRSDAAWPKPVWGQRPPRGYGVADRDRLAAALRRELAPVLI